jgi:ATP diphosphatase
MDARNAEDAVRAFARLLQTVRELRARCPWDREQTLESLAPHLIEEAYEALDEVERHDTEALAGELGDLFSQILSLAVIAEESHKFSPARMISLAADKLIRRHPHVYGEVKAESVGQVLENWGRIKAQERAAAGKTSALDGVAHALPALMRAEKLGLRARQAGMDWNGAAEVLAKVREELTEAEAALARGDEAAAVEELGDMMLAIANAPRFLGYNAEDTLRRACGKFVERFTALERLVAARGLELRKLSADQIEAIWQELKRSGK